MIDFDQQNRTIVAHADTAQSVSSLFVQQGQDGKLSPVDVTADKLTYVDAERRARYTGQCPGQEYNRHRQCRSRSMFICNSPAIESEGQAGVTAKTAKSIIPGSEGPSRIDHMVAIGQGCRHRTEPSRGRRQVGLHRRRREVLPNREKR